MVKLEKEFMRGLREVEMRTSFELEIYSEKQRRKTMSGKQSKEIRRGAAAAVHHYQAEIQAQTVVDVLARLYSLPALERIKWAVRIVRGVRRESLWMHRIIWVLDWALEAFTRWAGDKLYGTPTG
jgi:hypothetical protein